MKLLITFLLLSLQTLGQSKMNKNFKKKTISSSNISKVYLKNTLYGKDSTEMNKEQIEMFVNAWNQAKSKGLYKYIPQYWLSLYDKSGNKRAFRISNKLVKENGDIAFKLNFNISDFWDTKKTSPSKYEELTPITFIQSASKKNINTNKYYHASMTVGDKLPIDWVRKEHIDRLMVFLNSSDSCGCFLNNLSSYIPEGPAQQSGFAAIFIKAFKEKEPVALGLYACPLENKELNKQLVEWWKNYKLK